MSQRSSRPKRTAPAARRDGRPAARPGRRPSRAPLWWTRLRRTLDARLAGHGAHLALAFLLGFALWLRLFRLGEPAGSLIFDEVYYVNAARRILGWTSSLEGYARAPDGIDPNFEHPPGGKVLIALMLALFGDDARFYRLPSVASAMLGLVSVYGIGRALGLARASAVLAVGLVSFDVMSFIHGRIATLDMTMTGPMLAATWAALRGRWALAGLLFGVGGLSKIVSALGGLAVVGFLLWRYLALWRGGERPPWRAYWTGPLRMIALALLSGFVLLAALDSQVSNRPLLEHIKFLAGFGLTSHGLGETEYRAPWQWVLNAPPIDYLTISSGNNYTVLFRSLINPILLISLPLVLPYLLWGSRRRDADRFALCWMGANYLPYLLLWALINLGTYLYYAVPIIPGLALAIAIALERFRLRWRVLYLFAAAVFLLLYFPFYT